MSFGTLKFTNSRRKCFPDNDVKLRDDAVLQNLLLVIDVVQEKVQRGDALRQAAFQNAPIPFAGMMRGTRSKGKILLRARRIAIDIERDALPQKRQVDRVAFVLEFGRIHRIEERVELAVMGPDHPLGIQHLIEKLIVAVFS